MYSDGYKITLRGEGTVVTNYVSVLAETLTEALECAAHFMAAAGTKTEHFAVEIRAITLYAADEHEEYQEYI